MTKLYPIPTRPLSQAEMAADWSHDYAKQIADYIVSGNNTGDAKILFGLLCSLVDLVNYGPASDDGACAIGEIEDSVYELRVFAAAEREADQ